MSILEDAAIDARVLSRDALDAGAEAFASVADDPECDPVERIFGAARLAAFRDELNRRDRVARLATNTVSRHDRTHATWLALARQVRQRCEVPDILALAGVPLRRAGTSRGRAEWCGPCPICNDGDDRLRTWSGPNGRLWCRVCHWSGDAIAAASFITGTGQFRDCVRFLAEHASLDTSALALPTSTQRPALRIGGRR